MDRRISELRRAIERSPDDLGLRAHLIQARARARDPKLLADFERLALMLEALGAIAARHGAFLEDPADGPAGLIALLDKFERLQRHWSGLPQGFWDSGRQALEAYLRGRRPVLADGGASLAIAEVPKSPAPTQISIWEQASGSFGDLLLAAWGVPKAERSPLDLIRGLLDEAAALLRLCYPERPHWSFELFALEELSDVEDPKRAAERCLRTYRHAFAWSRQRQREVLQSFDAERNRRDPKLRLFPVVRPGAWSWTLEARPPGPFTPLLSRLLARCEDKTWRRWSLDTPPGPFSELTVHLLRLGRRWYLLKGLCEESVIGYLEGEVEV